MFVMEMVRKGQICNLIDGVKPTLLMLVAQVAFAAVNVLYKLAASQGMSLCVIVAYRFIFATAVMVPLAFLFERKSRPRVTWTVLFQSFFCGLLGGSLGQNLFLKSLVLTSATFATAMINLVPAITFILSIFFGLEKLALGTKAGKAKVLGTSMGIGGAMVLTFYKGAPINFLSSKVNLLATIRHVAPSHSPSHDHVLGASLALACCFSYALWLILQAKMSENFAWHYTSTALMCFMASVQGVVFAFCVEKDWSQWKLGWDIRLLSVAYLGIVASGLMVAILSWCVRMRGPLFVSMFNPLMLLMVALIGAWFLDEKLYLGSILGGILIVCGLYSVLWGKGKEMKKMSQLVPSRSIEHEALEIVVSAPADDKITQKGFSVKE